MVTMAYFNFELVLINMNLEKIVHSVIRPDLTMKTNTIMLNSHNHHSYS